MCVAVASAVSRKILRLCLWFIGKSVPLTVSPGHCTGIDIFPLLSFLRLKFYHELGG